MDKELIELVLNCLPDELLEDNTFLEFKNKFLKISDDAKITGYITLTIEMYIKIMDSSLAREVFNISEDNRILSLKYFTGEWYILNIYNYDDDFVLQLKVVEATKIHNISLSIFEDIRRIEMVTEVKKDNLWEDYLSDIKYYDEDGNLIDTDVQKELDEIFSDKFLVPLQMANFLRTNFQRFKDRINIAYAKEMMVSYDNGLSEEELFSFEGPFNLEKLKEFIIDYARKRLYNIFLEVGIDDLEYTLNIKYKNEHVIDNIASNLLLQIGEGEVVFSKNLIDNLRTVLDDLSMKFVCTKGFIMKKLGDSFILYYVCIENDIVTLMPQELSSKEAQELFSKGDNKTDNGLLKDFFGINRLR